MSSYGNNKEQCKLIQYLTGEMHSYENGIDEILDELSAYKSSIDIPKFLNNHIINIFVNIDMREIEIYRSSIDEYNKLWLVLKIIYVSNSSSSNEVIRIIKSLKVKTTPYLMMA